jgi:deoxycytidylate deaminase
MSEDDLFRILESCRLVSKKSKYRIQMSCIILDHGRMIGKGYNQIKSHPRWSYGLKTTIHAECSAIINTRKRRVYGTIAFIYRETRRGKPALARPCENCMKELKEFGIKKVIYSIGEEPYFKIEKL